MGAARALLLYMAAVLGSTAIPAIARAARDETRGGSAEAGAAAIPLRIDRAGRVPRGLPIGCGVAVAPASAESGFELRGPSGALEAEISVLGRHADGRPGFLLVELADPALDAVELVESAEAEPPEPPRAVAAGEAEGELAPLPELAAELVGRGGGRAQVRLRAVDAVARGAFARVDRLVGDLAGADGRPLLRVEAWATRTRARPDLVGLELVLRNDFLDHAHGPVAFRDLRVRVASEGWPRLAVAWAEANGARVEPGESGAPVARLFAEVGPEELWLGDRQGKAWRALLGSNEVDDATWEDARDALERPTLLVAPQAAHAASGWWGPLPESVATPAEASGRAYRRLRWSWEDGWSGSRADVKFSRTTGSARSGPHLEATLRFLQSGDRRFFDLVLETAYQQALRPLFREFRASEHPDVWLWDGAPRGRSGADLLGRDDPRSPPPPWRVERELEWLDEWHGWNGFDFEHLTVDLVRDAHLFTGSPWLRREALCIGEALRTYEHLRAPRPPSNSRSFGWMLRALAQLDAIDPGGGWEADARTLIEGAERHAPTIGAHRWLATLAPDERGLADRRFEYPWQLAVALHGLDAWLERAPAGAPERPAALRLACELAHTLAGPCFDRATGRFKRAVSPDDPDRFEPGLRGTEEWIPSALVLARERAPETAPAGAPPGFDPDAWVEAARRHVGALPHGAAYDDAGESWRWLQPFAAARERGFRGLRDR